MEVIASVDPTIKERVLAIKEEMEVHTKGFHALGEELAKLGYQCVMNLDHTVYITKNHVEEYGVKPQQQTPQQRRA